MRNDIPHDPGTYALIMKPIWGGEVTIGKRGMISLRGGWFVYVGSAFGPGGLAARIGRHLSKKERLHWHIDYLLTAVKVAEVWFTLDQVKKEEEWAVQFSARDDADNPMHGFGSGDCGCPGHLFWFRRRPRFKELKSELSAGEELFRVFPEP